jgi:signal peptidase I
MENKLKVGDKVWVEMTSFGCHTMKVWGTIVGFTAKRIKVENEVRGTVGNYEASKVTPR